MPWIRKSVDQYIDRCRFAVRAALFVNAILLSLASIYLTGKIIWFLLRFLNRTIFASPW